LYRNYRPLKFFGLMAIILMLIALLMFLPVFAEYLETGLVPKIPTLIVSGLLALAALMSTFGGLILDTIANNARKDFELRMNALKILLSK